MADRHRVPACGLARPALARLLGVVLGVLAALALAAGVNPAHAAATHSARQATENAGPGRTIVSQIHNAPGWRPSHSYTAHTGPYTRVVNGPGWNEASGTYNPGKRLDAYQLVSHGSCVSGRNGGPSGTGADIADGTCRWKYLSRVDYISITGWAFDNRHWESGTAYRYGDYVVSDSPLRAYEQVRGAGCTSTVAPTGTADGSGSAFTTSDGCRWKYWADVIYSSERSYIPTQRYLGSSKQQATYEMAANYQADIWNDREYVAGRHGEAVPIRLQAHHDYTHDGFPYSPEGISFTCGRHCAHHQIIVTTAPGESFADSLTPGDPLTGYDPAKGVAIRNPSAGVLRDGFELRDNGVKLIGLQIKSDYGIGLGGGETHGGNVAFVLRSIVDGGRGRNNPAVFLDAWTTVANSLVVAHGTFGIRTDYPGTVLHSTLVNPDRIPDSFAIVSGHDWVFVGETVSNTAIFGFAHAAGFDFQGWNDMTWLGGHNATDAPAVDNGSFKLGRGERVTAGMLPRTTYGESASKAFVTFPGDYRLRDGSPLIGAGSAVGPFNPACPRNKPCRKLFTFDSPDIIGTARPQAGRYDIGAWQSGPVPPQAAAAPAQGNPSGAAAAVQSWGYSAISAVSALRDKATELSARLSFVVSKAEAKVRAVWRH